MAAMGSGSQVVLVTGAAGALGSAVSRHLVSLGYRVALVDTPHGRKRLDELTASLEKGKASAFDGDITVEATWKDGLARVEKELGELPSGAALIAGGWQGGAPLHEAKDDAVWQAMMSSNLETVHRSLRALLPSMVAKKHGSVVVVGSRNVEQPWTGKGAAAYTAAKSAVAALARAVAAEVLEHGVRVNVVMPSTLDTPANRAAMPKADPSRWVSTSSAARVIAFLLSDDAADISGAVLPLYGRA